METTRTFEDGGGAEITLERDRIVGATAIDGSPYISVEYKPHVWSTSEGNDSSPASASILADVHDFERWAGIKVDQIQVVSSGGEHVLIVGI